MQPLELEDSDFRDLAEVVVEAGAAFLAGLDERPIAPRIDGPTSVELFAGPPPESGLGLAALDELLVVAQHGRGSNGRFFGYVHGSGEPVAALADLFASVINQNLAAWRSSPSGVTIERTVVGWLAAAIGCEGFSGSLTSGGSLANLMGLAMAREAWGPGVVYASQEVHMSISKAVALLGLDREASLHLVPVDDDFRMDVGALSAAIEEDVANGRRPMAVVASAGTVNTGAIDPLAAIADVVRGRGMWLHVDGAYGVPAAIAVPSKFAGLSAADSLSLDAHKWLYQPLDASVLLFRDRTWARQAFSDTGDYARTTTSDPVEGFAFFDESIELSRRFRALKLWLSLRYHGLGAFRAAISENLRQAQLLADLVDAEPSLERLAPVELSAVCFRWTGAAAEDLDEANADLLARVNRRGRVYLSNATLRGAFALRACITNHRTTDKDIRAVVDEVRAASNREI